MSLNNSLNRKITISTGKSREDKSWKNKETTWEKLCETLAKPEVTSESYAQYIAMTPDAQMRIKDVGGFVGGVIRGGRRVKNSCTARSVITLDIDICSEAIVQDAMLMYDCAMFIHTTHKHSTLTPRYRIVIPMNRDVLADEYEAIARRVAGDIGIERFDPTTFQPERLMFWPSVSSDAKYETWLQEGGFLDVDKVLDKYDDWRDMAQWPVSEKSKKGIKSKISKQEDPNVKAGMIGVFCRAYGMEAAREKFLSEVYDLTDGHEDRWTYKMGSTSGGVILYDDKFAFSYHSTDPAEGRLCNSFDLVRIHMFGDLDADIDDKMPANKRPSFMKMVELLSKDSEVKKIGLSEQLIAANAAFADMDLEWTELLEVDKKGGVLPTTANLVTILNNDENLKNCLSYDEFDKRYILQRSVPWRTVTSFTRDLTDVDEANYRNYFEKNYKIVTTAKIKDAIDIVLRQNLFHPVKDYLSALKWDGTDRLDGLLIEWLGAENSDYVKAVTRKTFVAAVKRIYEPGCKFDTVLTLMGPQGLGKSRIIKSMGGRWFSDTFGSLANNGAMENIQGVWLMEIGEMAGLKTAEQNAVKNFIAKTEDRFRPSYGRRPESFPRQCIFIASTNEEFPLHDHTGGRRYWLVRLTKKLGDNLPQDYVDQVWAEAVDKYRAGEKTYLEDDVESAAKELQTQHTETDDRNAKIEGYVNMQVPMNWECMDWVDRNMYMHDEHEDKDQQLRLMNRVSVDDIWIDVFKGTHRDMTPFNTRFIRHAMNKMPGWISKMYTLKCKTYRGWERVDTLVLSS